MMSAQDRLLLALLTLLWGVNWPVMKLGLRGLPPLSFRVMCMVGGALLLAMIARAQGHSLRVARAHWAELFWLGLSNMVLWCVLSILGVKLLASGRAAILGYTMPVWTALLGWLIWRDPIKPRMAVGVLGAIGVVLLLVAGEPITAWWAGQPAPGLTALPDTTSTTLWGTLAMLGAAISWAVGTQQMNRRKLPGAIVVLTFWMTVQALVACVVLAAWLEDAPWAWLGAPLQVPAMTWLAVGYNVTLVFGVSQLLWFRMASRLPPVASGLSVMLIPVVGLFSGLVMLGEQPAWFDLAALACALVSIASVVLPARDAKADRT